ncbi:hypothetical protein KW801_03750 [Candidatus Saccharibacteria bacterium]|nr:hypothetical protein [Candidatus Saccharibacteria bacterium]
MNQDENSPWQYKPDGKTASANLPDDNGSESKTKSRASSQLISWQAAEFIEHQHSSSWYAALIAGTALLAALVYLATKDIFAAGTIIVVGVIVGVFAGHKPGQVQYEISESGLSVNGKNYPYSAFKSFAVLREGNLSSVNLFPLKRFMPPVSAYFEPGEEPKIVDALGNHLPYEDRKMDGIDRLSRRLRL